MNINDLVVSRETWCNAGRSGPGLGEAVAMPTNPDPASTLLRSTGNFMGGNVRLPLSTS